MTLDQVKQHYKVTTNKDLTSLVGKSKGTLTLWGANGIPPGEQAIIQIRTKNKLKADLPPLKTPQPKGNQPCATNL